MKKIEEVSEIFCKVRDKNIFSYGFTVSYNDGSFRNIIYQSQESDNKELREKLELRRMKLIKSLTVDSDLNRKIRNNNRGKK